MRHGTTLKGAQDHLCPSWRFWNALAPAWHSPFHVGLASDGSAFNPFLHNGNEHSARHQITEHLAVPWRKAHTPHEACCRERDVADLISESPLACDYHTCASIPVLGGGMSLCTVLEMHARDMCSLAYWSHCGCICTHLHQRLTLSCEPCPPLSARLQVAIYWYKLGG